MQLVGRSSMSASVQLSRANVKYWHFQVLGIREKHWLASGPIRMRERLAADAQEARIQAGRQAVNESRRRPRSFHEDLPRNR